MNRQRQNSGRPQGFLEYEGTEVSFDSASLDDLKTRAPSIQEWNQLRAYKPKSGDVVDMQMLAPDRKSVTATHKVAILGTFNCYDAETDEEKVHYLFYLINDRTRRVHRVPMFHHEIRYSKPFKGTSAFYDFDFNISAILSVTSRRVLEDTIANIVQTFCSWSKGIDDEIEKRTMGWSVAGAFRKIIRIPLVVFVNNIYGPAIADSTLSATYDTDKVFPKQSKW